MDYYSARSLSVVESCGFCNAVTAEAALAEWFYVVSLEGVRDLVACAEDVEFVKKGYGYGDGYGEKGVGR